MDKIFKSLNLPRRGTRGLFLEENLEETENFLQNKEEITKFEWEFVAYINEIIEYSNKKPKPRKHEIGLLFRNIFNALTIHEHVNRLLEEDKRLKQYNLEEGLISVITGLKKGEYHDRMYKCFRDFLSYLLELFWLYIEKMEFAQSFDIKQIRNKETMAGKIIKTALKYPELTQMEIAERTGAAYGTVKNTMSKHGKSNKKVT